MTALRERRLTEISDSDALTALPIVSNNCINGTWAPVLDNTTTTLYTFTPDASECATTQTMTITVNPFLFPAISCGTSSITSTQFSWAVVPGATSYTVSYTINSGSIINIGDIGNVLTYTASSTGPNPIIAGDSVEITVTPVGATGTCFELNAFTCTAANCIPPTLILSSAVNTDSQTVCLNTAIVDITYDLPAGASGATGVMLST